MNLETTTTTTNRITKTKQKEEEELTSLKVVNGVGLDLLVDGIDRVPGEQDWGGGEHHSVKVLGWVRVVIGRVDDNRGPTGAVGEGEEKGWSETRVK